jgi:putative DNA primase/helicase
MLPRVIANFAFDVAERIGVDPAIVACPMLVVCASALDDLVKVRPKEYDDSWNESARLNVLIAAGSGSNKSGAIHAATSPYKKIELQWREEDNRAFAQWEQRARINEALMKHAEREIRKNGDVTTDVEEPLPPPEAKPRRRRLVMNDTTAEGVCKLLADNPRGILLEVDEAVGWLRSFDVYRNGGPGRIEPFGCKRIMAANSARTALMTRIRCSSRTSASLWSGAFSRISYAR